jgi:hypothetical protein
MRPKIHAILDAAQHLASIDCGKPGYPTKKLSTL